MVNAFHYCCGDSVYTFGLSNLLREMGPHKGSKTVREYRKLLNERHSGKTFRNKCYEKSYYFFLTFDFPYRRWVSLRTTNIIERVFREFRRRIKVMDTFPTEESCIRIIFSPVQMINEDWKNKPMKSFR